MRVAALNRNTRKQWFAACYDEVTRKSWSERAYSNDRTLNLEVEADAVCKNLEEKAIAKYDAIEKVLPLCV